MTDTRLWDDVVREKLERIASDLRLIMVRLDRLEAMQGGGLSVSQAMTALDRYDTQEEADLDLRRRVEALERANKLQDQLNARKRQIDDEVEAELANKTLRRKSVRDAMQEIDALVGASTPDIGLHSHKPFGGNLYDNDTCEFCDAAPGDEHAPGCSALTDFDREVAARAGDIVDMRGGGGAGTGVEEFTHQTEKGSIFVQEGDGKMHEIQPDGKVVTHKKRKWWRIW